MAFSGLVEAGFESVDGDASSQIFAAEAEVGLELTLDPSVGGTVLVKVEDGTMFAEEAFVHLALTEEWTIYAGLRLLPFGVFGSGLPSDPLTKELGETHATMAACHCASGMGWGEAAVFNGAIGINEAPDDRAGGLLVAVGATLLEGLDVTVAFLSNIGDTNRMAGELAVTDIAAAVPGAALTVAYTRDPFRAEVEYIGALRAFGVSELDFDADGDGDTPATGHVEIMYKVREGLQAGVRYAVSTEALDLPAAQITAGVVWAMFEHTALAMDIAANTYNEDLDTDDTTAVTIKLTGEF
ncbi:MAG: LbtU family siderophore porin [Planctomycetota bacterium]